MSPAPPMRGDPFRHAAGWTDAPDVQFVGQGALNEVDEFCIGGPQGKVRVEPSRRGKDGLAGRAAPGVGEEHRVAGPGRVVHEPRGVAGPVELSYAFEVWLRLSAQRGYGPD